MDPGRRAMLSDPKSSSNRRDVTSPRYDSSNRVSKPSRSAPGKGSSNSSKFISEEEASRRFVADEDKFVLKQAKKKADIRVREGRAKPIDFLAFNLRYIDEERDVFDDLEGDDFIDVPLPAKVVQDLDVAGLKELESEIASYYALEKDSRNREYWEALRALCRNQREKLNPHGHERRVVSSVADDIDRILEPKTYDQLEGLEKQIRAKLRSDEDIDIDYWEQLLNSLLVWKSKAVLSRTVETISEKKKQRQSKLGGAKPAGAAPTPVTQPTNSAIAASQSAAASGNDDASQATKALYDREAARGVSENEEVFAAEEEVPSGSQPQWGEKVTARKPRYFNRVQMGYEWNKYNQTHYDHDNPPPKVVQGYKFNVFYPELIDKTKAPTYKIIREHGRRRGESFAAAGEDDTCLIRFTAGPPYEDVAFRIVDREWDYSAKRDRGFKSSFDKGILQLHFQFKKIFYRK
ncbi:hypothetical protein K4F52_004016 [Lecanicillium sp. MT-2017a]|nr:hypothetical protein K4F52_004016 [Lecanicillium sp. MT-2017a]